MKPTIPSPSRLAGRGSSSLAPALEPPLTDAARSWEVSSLAALVRDQLASGMPARGPWRADRSGTLDSEAIWMAEQRWWPEEASNDPGSIHLVLRARTCRRALDAKTEGIIFAAQL